jgi:hypothetical protein
VVFIFLHNMDNLKKYLLYSITVVVIIASFIWESYMQKWLAEQPDNGDNVVRTDLFVLYPLVITLVAVSLYTLFKRR